VFSLPFGKPFLFRSEGEARSPQDDYCSQVAAIYTHLEKYHGVK